MTVSHKYDPNRPHGDRESHATTAREEGRSFMVLGAFLLLFALLLVLFVGWDFRTGNMMMIGLLIVSAVLGLISLIVGAIKRNATTGSRTRND